MLRPAANPARAYRRFCRAAALAFGLVAVYTLVIKAPSGELARDWTHTVLHVVTGAVAGYAGWVAADAAARVFTVALLGGYGALAVVGPFIDGLLLDTRFRVPLDAPDDVFHLLLAAAAAAVVVRTRGRLGSALSRPRA